MEEQPKKIKRNIILLYDFSESAEHALHHAISLSYALKSGLVIACPQVVMKNINNDEVRHMLARRTDDLRKQQGIDVQAFVLPGSVKSFFKPLYEKVEGIVIVTGVVNQGFVCGIKMTAFLKMVRRSRIPWLTVPIDAPVTPYTHIVVSVSYSRQNKEKVAWASYFHRLNKSTIHALTPQGKDGFIKTGIRNNTDFLKKMYATLEVYYKLVPTDKNIHQIDDFAIEYAVEHSAGLLIALVTPRPDIFDLLTGAVERKLILNVMNMPILCLNPLDDMYVVCA